MTRSIFQRPVKFRLAKYFMLFHTLLGKIKPTEIYFHDKKKKQWLKKKKKTINAQKGKAQTHAKCSQGKCI